MKLLKLVVLTTVVICNQSMLAMNRGQSLSLLTSLDRARLQQQLTREQVSQASSSSSTAPSSSAFSSYQRGEQFAMAVFNAIEKAYSNFQKQGMQAEIESDLQKWSQANAGGNFSEGMNTKFQELYRKQIPTMIAAAQTWDEAYAQVIEFAYKLVAMFKSEALFANQQYPAEPRDLLKEYGIALFNAAKGKARGLGKTTTNKDDYETIEGLNLGNLDSQEVIWGLEKTIRPLYRAMLEQKIATRAEEVQKKHQQEVTEEKKKIEKQLELRKKEEDLGSEIARKKETIKDIKKKIKKAEQKDIATFNAELLKEESELDALNKEHLEVLRPILLEAAEGAFKK